MRKNDFLKITETYITGVEAFAHLLLCLKKKRPREILKKMNILFKVGNTCEKKDR